MPRKVKKPHFSNLKITSIISITLVLFVIGLLVLLLQMANKLTRQTKESVEVTIVLTDSITDEQLAHMDNYLSIAEFVNTYSYISKDSALVEHIADMGEDPSEYLGYNPLLASYQLTVKANYANNDSLQNIETRLRHFDCVNDIIYQKDILELLNKNVHRIGIMIAILAIVLLFISIVLLNNTIRLTIYSRRFTINTMKLVGAKSLFIKRPFVLQSIGMGLIAALLATLLLAGALLYVNNEIVNIQNLFTFSNLAPVVGIIIVVSILITWLSASWAVGHYIRTKTDRLYYI